MTYRKASHIEITNAQVTTNCISICMSGILLVEIEYVDSAVDFAIFSKRQTISCALGSQFTPCLQCLFTDKTVEERFQTA